MRVSVRFAPLVLLASSLANAQSGSLSGSVRDMTGKPVGGVKLTVSCPRGSSPSVAVTNQDGAYRVVGLGVGKCLVSVQSSVMTAPSERSFQVTTNASSQIVDFTVERGSPHFEAAGIRSLVDAAGYSAPASGAAAKGLLSGVADIKRAGDKELSTSSAFPCAREPELKQAVDAAPGDAEAMTRLARFYNLRGEFEKARQSLNTITAHSSEPEIHALLAQAEEGLGMFTEASVEYQTAARMRPNEQYLFGVGYERILSGRPGEGEKAFQAGLIVKPRSIQLLIGLGVAQFLDRQPSEAVRSLLGAINVDPSDPRPYPFLVKAFGNSDADAEIVRARLRQFHNLVPDDAQANYLYAMALLYKPVEDHAKEIEVLLIRATQLDPKLAEAHFELANLCAAREDTDCALRHYEAAVRLSPGQARFHYHLAGAYRKAGQPEPAAKELAAFEEIHAREKGSEANAIDLQQFVSVLGNPARSGDDSVPCGPGAEK